MNPFKNMDLYKGIILASLVLLPVTGFWCNSLNNEIKATRAAIDEAIKPGGLLEQIGSLQKKVELVESNRMSTSDATRMHQTYFAQQIANSTRGPLAATDYDIAPSKEDVVRTGTKQVAIDHVVAITWGKPGASRKEPVSRDFLFALLFNCESGARRASEQSSVQSIWKLRKLTIENATTETLLGKSAPPPPELEDKWFIRALEFVRREPKKEGRGT